MRDADYLSAFLHILLPVALEVRHMARNNIWIVSSVFRRGEKLVLSQFWGGTPIPLIPFIL